jgi:hypothetical protein
MTRKYPITAGRIIEAVAADANLGICTACGAERDGCEPDARNYKCEECGERAVFGAEHLLIGGC